MIPHACDVLIVGGGPGGLVAAREVARANPSLDVLLIERDRAIGAPVRCGEGVATAGISEFLDPRGASWVSRHITKMIIWAPDGTEVLAAEGDVGYILDRSRFEPALAAEAGREGVEICVGTEATAMLRTGDGWDVSVRGLGGEQTIRARLVIAADGVEGMVARWAGLDTRVPARDMESCAQYLVAGIDFDPDALYLHYGNEVAPGGYAWVFPKGVGVANVGLGILALKADGRPARQYLDAYIDRYFPTGVKTGYTVGGVIVHTTIRRTVTDALLVCGDAAHMVNPVSGAGIVNAMKAGRLAGHVAADALAAGDTSAARLQRYHDEWMSLLGDDHARFHKLKEVFVKFDDDFLNALAQTLNKVPREQRSLRRVLTSALVHHPTLFPAVAKYFL